MKIAILLPYKEDYTQKYSGAHLYMFQIFKTFKYRTNSYAVILKGNSFYLKILLILKLILIFIK